jgi:PiT family inorganic phosphate transporter
LRLGITKELCLCAGVQEEIKPLPQPDGLLAAQAMPQFSITVGQESECFQRYAGRVFGLNAGSVLGSVLNALHVLSAGAVSFARGLNDTPKIAALLLVAKAFAIHWDLLVVASAMAVGKECVLFII